MQQIWCSTSVSSKRTFSGRNTNVSSFQLQRCNFVYVNFRTDGSGAGRGFNLTFNWLISGKYYFVDLICPDYFENLYFRFVMTSFLSGRHCTCFILSLLSRLRFAFGISLLSAGNRRVDLIRTDAQTLESFLTSNLSSTFKVQNSQHVALLPISMLSRNVRVVYDYNGSEWHRVTPTPSDTAVAT